jgi:hypothetical protein
MPLYRIFESGWKRPRMNDDEFRDALATLASTRSAAGTFDARAAVGTRARRYRRRRRALLATIAVAAAAIVVVAVVALTGMHRPQAVTVRGGGSTAVGHIDACSGLSEPKQFVGGTVVALRGRIRFERIGRGVSKQVLPGDVVAREVVPAGAEYHFTLPAADYVIDLPHYQGATTASTHASVAVRAHQTVQADLPNDCL